MMKIRRTPLRNTLLVILSMLLMLALCAHFPVFARGEDEATSVTLTTELSTYSTETKRILVHWENRGDTEFEYGEDWSLERKKDGQWEAVKTNGDYEFNSLAYILPPEAKAKQVYKFSMYTGNLTPGIYRIVADYIQYRGPGDYTKYPVYAEITIVKSEGYEDTSELSLLDLGEDYIDITFNDAFNGTTAHIYKNKKT